MNTLSRFAFAFLFVLPLAAQAQFDLTPKRVTVTLFSEASTVAAGQAFRVAVKLEHETGFHTYGKVLNPPDTGIITTVKWNLPDGWKAEELPWPATHMVASAGGEKVAGYDGIVYLPFRLTPPATLAGALKLEATMKGAVCDKESCVPMTRPLNLELKTGAAPVIDAVNADIFKSVENNKTASSTAITPPVESLGYMLLFAFLGGLILNIMPCVFPVLGIKITSVVQQSGGDRKTILLHGLTYTLGVLVSFWVLVAVLQSLRSGGQQLSWGFQLQSPLFVYGVVLVLTVFGLNMAGLFEVGASAIGVGSGLQMKSGLGGSFFTGLLATVVATPCAAPFLAPALTYGLALSLWPSLFFFSVIGLGLASPYLALSFFPPLLRLLPRPGAWMESFKQAMSFLMLGAAAFFIWVLMGLTSDTSQRDLLLGLVIVAAACWIYGRWSVPSKPTPTRIKAVVMASAFLALGLWWSWPQGKDDLFKAWSPELVQTLRAEKKPIYIDFTARWCATCQVNKRVYKDTSLRDEFKKLGVVLLKADWTNPDPRIDHALAELKESAVPVNVLYVPGRDEPVVLSKNLTVDGVKTTLAELDKAAK